LPGEVGAGGEGDRLAELDVFDLGDRARDSRVEGDGTRDLGGATLGQVRGRVDGADSEAEGAQFDSRTPEAGKEGVGKERELGRPHARRRPDDEDSIFDCDRAGPFRDPRADRGRPDVGRDRCAARGEAIFARAGEDVLDRLWSDELFATAPRHGWRGA
jgi:hypothetical protein